MRDTISPKSVLKAGASFGAIAAATMVSGCATSRMALGGICENREAIAAAASDVVANTDDADKRAAAALTLAALERCPEITG